MDTMWEFLSNNSPKLICKPRSKTPCFISENNTSLNIPVLNLQCKNMKINNKTPFKPNNEKSLNQIVPKIKPNYSVLTLRVCVKSPSA